MMILFLRLAPLCDWHHGSRHGGSLDPESEAIAIAILGTAVVLLGATLFMGIVGGPLLVAWTRKVRHLFWCIPAVNAAIYAIAVALRPYPGGFTAQFRVPGLFYTMVELILMIVLSLAAAGVLAIVYLVARLVRRTSRTLGTAGPPPANSDGSRHAVSPLTKQEHAHDEP